MSDPSVLYRNAMIRGDRRHGMTISELAANYKLSKAMIHKICTTDADQPARRLPESTRLPHISASLTSGLSIETIAREQGVSTERVYQIAGKHRLLPKAGDSN